MSAMLKKIPRQVIILGMISLFTDAASEMLYPIVPIFLTAALGASMAVIGLIEGIAEVTAGFLKGYFGMLSDRLRKRALFVKIGYTLSALVKPLPGIFPAVSTVLISRTSDRIGKGIRTAPRDALLAANSDGNTGAIFGFHRGMDTIGAVIGPLTALVLLYFFPGNYILVFLVAAIPSSMAIVFAFRIKDNAETKVSKKAFSYSRFWKSASPTYKSILILVTVFSFVNSSDVFLILKSKYVADSDTIAVLGYVFYNIIYAIFSYPLGILADKFGKRNVFIIGLIIFSLVYFGFALNEEIIIIWVLFAFYGIYTADQKSVV